MNNNSNEIQIKKINQMLFEMATGNLAFRIKLDSNDKQLEELAEMLNAVAEKLQLIISPGKQNLDNISLNSNVSVQTDAVLLQNIYEYITEHLDEPLPSTKELSKMFGTNEFKLKDSFRHFFKTSIYQFYNDERLKKAHQLIEQTSIPIKEIAFISGFNDYTNFYKAFKKKYGYSPSDLNRKAIPEEEK